VGASNVPNFWECPSCVHVLFIGGGVVGRSSAKRNPSVSAMSGRSSTSRVDGGGSAADFWKIGGRNGVVGGGGGIGSVTLVRTGRRHKRIVGQTLFIARSSAGMHRTHLWTELGHSSVRPKVPHFPVFSMFFLVFLLVWFLWVSTGFAV
jgi:hypothetical protein